MWLWESPSTIRTAGAHCGRNRHFVSKLADGFGLCRPREIALLGSEGCDAHGILDHSFDLTMCIQNGISAFGVDQQQLFAEAIRVTRPRGTVLFSSYSHRFWEERLKWFEIQAEEGLIGEIDYRGTGNGVIVCKDGFRATTVDAERFRSLAAALGLVPNIIEVDGSSLFCELALR